MSTPKTASGTPCKLCIAKGPGGRCHHHCGSTTGSPAKTTPPRKVPRSPVPKSRRIYDSPSPTSRRSPKSPSKQRMRSIGVPPKVKFSPTKAVAKIPTRDKSVKGGIAWAQPVTDLQADCISSVMEVYGIWDREDLEIKGKRLSEDEKRLVTSCVRIMEGDVPSSPYRREIQHFSASRERHRDRYRKMTIDRENVNF